MKRLVIVITTGLALMVSIGVLARIASDLARPTVASTSTLTTTASGQVPSRVTGCSQGSFNPPSSALHDLDEDAADWGVYCEDSPLWVKENVAIPSIDGKSLRCGITGGNAYSNVHCYRNLLPEPTATMFTLTLSFWFSPTTTFNNQGDPSVVQALEFTMNKWHQAKRYEFALQWQNVGPSAPQWRYWNPHQAEKWVSLGITDTLEGGQWHTFVLEGEILNDQVHYLRFSIDQQSYNLNVLIPPASVPGEPDRLAIAVQLDGNFEEAPYDVFIDKVSFVRILNAYLPSITKLS